MPSFATDSAGSPPTEWYVQMNFVWQGPFTIFEVRAMVDSGVIDGLTGVRKGNGKARQAGRCLEIKGHYFGLVLSDEDDY